MTPMTVKNRSVCMDVHTLPMLHQDLFFFLFFFTEIPLQLIDVVFVLFFQLATEMFHY